MRILKFTADRVFDGYSFLPSGTVVITDEEGVIKDIVTGEIAGDDVSVFKGILSPGLVNCHCHLELSHMKGLIPPGTGLVDFVLGIVQQRHLPETLIMEAIEKAEMEMVQNGIVAVGDICNNTLTIPQKTKGNIYYHNFIEASGFNPAIAAERFTRSENIFREYGKLYSIPIGSCSIVPHAPYSVADALFEKIVHFPGNHLLTIHNQESEDENTWFRDKSGPFNALYERMNLSTEDFQPTGKSSLQSFLPKLLPNQALILVHNVHSSEEDIAFAEQSDKKICWCLCPNANDYISGSKPPVDLLIKNNCTIVLGTDSLASNYQLSIVEEMRMLNQHFPNLSIETLLRWATSNGALALEMDSILGSIAVGKKPGLVVIDDELSAGKRII